MQLEIGYELAYEYFKESYGQTSWQKQTTLRLFLPWDGVDSPEALIRQAHPEFGTDIVVDSDKNHRIEVTCLRIGGEKNGVIVAVEKQTFSIERHLLVEM
jgi:hypothetical protein